GPGGGALVPPPGGGGGNPPGPPRGGGGRPPRPPPPAEPAWSLPAYGELVEVFGGFYFGGDPEGDPRQWRGFIGSEPLLVERPFFESLSRAGIAWGFVSGAEPPSARYVLNQRLGLEEAPLIAMGEAPEKPDPTGLLRLAGALAGGPLGPGAPPVAYLGDTVADVLTVVRAREACPGQPLFSLAVAPPHLQGQGQEQNRLRYEQNLRAAGAEWILPCTAALAPEPLLEWLEGGGAFSAPSPRGS
ncbi:MAG: HAD family hydrolase, partial [Prochlorococcaceae cyanobacterium]